MVCRILLLFDVIAIVTLESFDIVLYYIAPNDTNTVVLDMPYKHFATTFAKCFHGDASHDAFLSCTETRWESL